MKHNAQENFTNVKEELKKKTNEDELFSNILGYEDIKSELKLIRSWYLDKNIQRDKKIILPKGVIFYGKPGCGKTLFSVALAKSFNWPIIIIEGTDHNEIIKNIHDSFDKARKCKGKKAVIVIDEMDLLISRSDSIAHALQTEIDGFNKEDSQFFVIATTNHLYEIPDPLQRPGRFDRLIEVKRPNEKNRKMLFEKFFEYYGLNYGNIDFVEINRVINHVSGADIKAICNDVYLRVGNNVSTDEVIFSYERVINNKYLKEEPPKRDYTIAVHEAGHVIACLKNNDYTFFHHAIFVSGGAVTYTNLFEKDYVYRKNVISDIEISLAGMAAEKLILHSVDFGFEKDADHARSQIYRMIERGGYYGMKHFTIDHVCDRRFNEFSEKAVLSKEKLVYKAFKHFYKKIYKYLKHHKEDIIKVADFMYKNGTITYKDISQLSLSISNKAPSTATIPIAKPALAMNQKSKSNTKVSLEESTND